MHNGFNRYQKRNPDNFTVDWNRPYWHMQFPIPKKSWKFITKGMREILEEQPTDMARIYHLRYELKLKPTSIANRMGLTTGQLYALVEKYPWYPGM